MPLSGASFGRSVLKVLSKETGDPCGCIELRGTHEAVALALINLDLMRSALLLKQPLQRVSVRNRYDRV